MSDPDVIAHRGSSGIAPENTLAAVRDAIEQGASHLEVDVQRTVDGHLVLLHDDGPARTTDVAAVFPDRRHDPVDTFTLAELRRLDAGSWFGPEFAGEPIPTLDELVALAGSRIGVLLEVKDPVRHPGIEHRLAEVLRGTDGQVVVQSFDHDAMQRFAALAPRVPVGLLTEVRLSSAELSAAARYARQVNPDLAVVDRDHVEEIHGLGMACNVYTVNAGRDMRALLAIGVDGIITDYPAVLLDLLSRRPAEPSRTHVTA